MAQPGPAEAARGGRRRAPGRHLRGVPPARRKAMPTLDDMGNTGHESPHHPLKQRKRMPFQPGKPKTGGRQRGTPNQVTGAFREAVLHVYKRLGGHAAFLAWARENPTEYYRIAARLIPVELRSEEDRTVRVIIEPAPPLNPPVMIEAHADDTQGSVST